MASLQPRHRSRPLATLPHLCCEPHPTAFCKAASYRSLIYQPIPPVSLQQPYSGPAETDWEPLPSASTERCLCTATTSTACVLGWPTPALWSLQRAWHIQPLDLSSWVRGPRSLGDLRPRCTQPPRPQQAASACLQARQGVWLCAPWWARGSRDTRHCGSASGPYRTVPAERCSRSALHDRSGSVSSGPAAALFSDSAQWWADRFWGPHAGGQCPATPEC